MEVGIGLVVGAIGIEIVVVVDQAGRGNREEGRREEVERKVLEALLELDNVLDRA